MAKRKREERRKRVDDDYNDDNDDDKCELNNGQHIVGRFIVSVFSCVLLVALDDNDDNEKRWIAKWEIKVEAG